MDNYNNVPIELKRLNQWMCWCLEASNGKKPSKVPYDAKTGKHGKSNDPGTWCSFEVAVDAIRDGKANCFGKPYDGIGFAFREGDGIVGIDVDHNWDSGISIGVRKRFVGTYCERSPSENLRAFCFGKPQRCGKGVLDKSIEIYNHGSPRYLTITGNRIEDSAHAVTEQQEALDWLHVTYMDAPTRTPQLSQNSQLSQSQRAGTVLSDGEILAKARSANNGGKFEGN